MDGAPSEGCSTTTILAQPSIEPDAGAGAVHTITLAGFTCFYCLPGESPATRFQCLSVLSQTFESSVGANMIHSRDEEEATVNRAPAQGRAELERLLAASQPKPEALHLDRQS